MGGVTSVTPRAPPQHGTHLMKTTGTSSERERPVSWSLHAGDCHPCELEVSIKPGTGNGTKHTNTSPVPGMSTMNLFPTILVGILTVGGEETWWHHLGHLSWGEESLLLTWSSQELGWRWALEMAENWRPQGRLARHPRMRSRDWKLSCCNYRLWNRCGTH